MLNVTSIFHRPQNQEQIADKKRSQFVIIESDHLTLLNVFNKYMQQENRMRFC